MKIFASVTPPQGQASNTRRGTRARAAWLMMALLLLLLCCIGFGACLVLDSSRETRLNTLERHMSMQAQHRVASLTVWFGGLQKTLEAFTSSDVVRLFASEASAFKEGGLEKQTNFMRSQLADFRNRLRLVGAALFLDERSATLMSGETLPPSAALSQDLGTVLKTGKGLVRPIRLDLQQNPVLDVLTPVFAPRYVDATGRKCVAVLLVSVDVADEVRKSPSGADGAFSRIMQYVDGSMWLTPGQSAYVLRLGPAWNPGAAAEGLPLAVRELPLSRGGVERVYSRGFAVPDLPWFVVQLLPRDAFEDGYEEFRRSVIIVSVLLSVLMALLLLMLWWWLFERHEQRAAKELRGLYKIVNRQKLLLEGINASIEDGIVLCSTSGHIVYVNDAFVAMSGEPAASLQNRDCSSLLAAELAQSLHDTLHGTLRSNKTLRTMETLTLQGKTRHYQLICTPFRAAPNAVVDTADGGAGVVLVYRDVTELVTLQERNQTMLTNTVQAFVRAVEAADEYLHGHSANISTLSSALARHMGLDNAATLVTAAQLSQVGMIRLPRKLLSKAGAFTAEERAEMEKHVSYALSALQDIDFGMPVQLAIGHMHERMDGSGYPLKLSGDAICVEGRILAVASTFCAMLRPRSYRKGLALDEALQLLDKSAAQYDARVLAALRAFLACDEGQHFLDTLKVKTQ